MYRFIIVIILFTTFLLSVAEVVIKVPRVNGDATQTLRDAIKEAASYKGENVII